MRLVKTLLGLAAACSCLAASDVKTLTIQVPEGHDEVTYDASRVSPEDLKHWLTLSPVLSQNTNLLVTESVLSCYVDDPAYQPCDPNPLILNASNAAHTQRRIGNRLDRLIHEQFPPDFQPIVNYFKAVQSFGLWTNEREIEFFRTKKVSSLENKYPSLKLDPEASCSSELDAIRKSTDEMSQWKLALFQWDTCMLKQFTAARGSYPQALWDDALRSRGIQEHVVVEENE